MSRFHAYTRFANPGLHIWREGTPTRLYLRPVAPAGPGWVEFEYGLKPGILNDVRFMLFDFDEAGQPGTWEKDDHQRKVPRSVAGELPDEIWFSQDAQRVLTSDPLRGSLAAVRVHLIFADPISSEPALPGIRRRRQNVACRWPTRINWGRSSMLLSLVMNAPSSF